MNKRQLKKIKQFKIKSIKKINYRENDKLVFSIDEKIQYENYKIITRDFKKEFNTNNIVLLSGGLNFEKVINDSKNSKEKFSQQYLCEWV